jgi:hypothetical protein
MMRYLIRDASTEMIDRQVGGRRGDSLARVEFGRQSSRAPSMMGRIEEKMGKDGIGGKRP